MSTKFQTLCSKSCAIRLSSSEDMSDYVTKFKNTFIECGFLHNVWNLVGITSPLEILNLNNSIESYDSKLRCPSFWDTLYVQFLKLCRIIHILIFSNNFQNYCFSFCLFCSDFYTQPKYWHKCINATSHSRIRCDVNIQR